MNISFPLVHISGNRVDTEATITLNALSTRADKEIVLQGTIDSISCRSDGEFVDSPVPFTVQYVEIGNVIPAYIIRVYDGHHVLLKDLQDGRLATATDEHLLRLLVERAGETYLQWADDPRKHHYYRGLPYKDTYRVLDGKLSQACIVLIYQGKAQVIPYGSRA